MMTILCSLDPKVSSMCKSQGKLKDGTLPEEARQLLKELVEEATKEPMPDRIIFYLWSLILVLK